MKYSNVRGGAVLLAGSMMVAVLSSSAEAGWGHRHGSYGGSSGVYAAGYGSSGAYAGYGSSGYGSSGYASYSSYGSSGYAASYGSSGYYGSSGRPGLLTRLHQHMAAKRAYRAARRASYGSSGYYASSGGSSGYSYSSTGGSSGYSVSRVYSGGSSGSYGSVGTTYSSGVSHGSVGTGVSTSGYYYGASKSSPAPTASIVSNVSGDSVYLTVAVPSDAKIFVNGKATTSTGSVREFVSRGLKPGKNYKFDVRAELPTADGDTITENKTLVVSAGEREQVHFAFAEHNKAIETAVTVNVPDGAEVYLSGNPTTAVGTTRTFRTSKLKPGDMWDDYQIEVRHGDNVKNQTVRLLAGDKLELTFAFDDDAEAKLASR